jgi:hypothetical protein
MSNASPSILAPLERFEQRVARGLRTLPLAQVSGLVVEVSMSHYRVAGLSRFLKLGESVGVDVGDRIEIGEVVRIDDASATLKPFDARSNVTIGARAFRTETLSLSPHRAWKGRVIDALGRPIDGAGELAIGDRPAPLDAPPPPPLRRARVLRVEGRIIGKMYAQPCLHGEAGIGFLQSRHGLFGLLVVAGPGVGRGEADERVPIVRRGRARLLAPFNRLFPLRQLRVEEANLQQPNMQLISALRILLTSLTSIRRAKILSSAHGVQPLHRVRRASKR